MAVRPGHHCRSNQRDCRACHALFVKYLGTYISQREAKKYHCQDYMANEVNEKDEEMEKMQKDKKKGRREGKQMAEQTDVQCTEPVSAL